MKFFSPCSNYSTHVKTSIEKGCSLAFGTFIFLVFTNHGLDLLGEKTADRSVAASRQNLGLPEHLSIETYRYVLFSPFS
jgi:hypothetical protein